MKIIQPDISCPCPGISSHRGFFQEISSLEPHLGPRFCSANSANCQPDLPPIDGRKFYSLEADDLDSPSVPIDDQQFCFSPFQPTQSSPPCLHVPSGDCCWRHFFNQTEKLFGSTWAKRYNDFDKIPRAKKSLPGKQLN